MSEVRLKELFAFTPIQQIRHWAGHAPWEDMRLENKVMISVNSVICDAEWNIIRMPLFMKPCFGQPTAFVRHGGDQPIVHPRFGTVKSRCMRCNAKESCERIAKVRLRATPDLKNAYVRFERAGGSFGLKNPSLCQTAQREFDSLIHALVAHGGFTSVNDEAATIELERRARARKERDAEKKRIARRKAIKRGDFTFEFIDLMERERLKREQALVAIKSLDGLPRNVCRMPLTSARITGHVWFARECKRIAGEKLNPSSIARALTVHWPTIYPPSRFNALRQRTGADLNRVATLERFVPKGHSKPVWPPFDLDSALDELDQLTPYSP